jgi:hypothetical protein
MGRRQCTPTCAEDIWGYLSRYHPDDAAGRRADIEERVEVLAKLGRDPVKIYSALRVGVQILQAHQRRLRHLATGRLIKSDQTRVLPDIERAIASLESWNRTWRIAEAECPELETLRALRSEFSTGPLPLSGDLTKHVRLPVGRPWCDWHQSDDLLRRERVPKEERRALLKALALL